MEDAHVPQALEECSASRNAAHAPLSQQQQQQHDNAMEEEEERAPHMKWTYEDHSGKTRHWTATRAIDTLRQPAPYVILW
jgi:hypothetical protein